MTCTGARLAAFFVVESQLSVPRDVQRSARRLKVSDNMRFSLKTVFAVSLIAAVIAWQYREHSLSLPPKWEVYKPSAVLGSIARGEIALVSITANQDPVFWRNEKTALSSKEQYRFLRDYRVATFRADYTFPNEEIRVLLEETGAEWGAMIVYSPHRPNNYSVLNGPITESRLRQAIAHSRYR